MSIDWLVYDAKEADVALTSRRFFHILRGLLSQKFLQKATAKAIHRCLSSGKLLWALCLGGKRRLEGNCIVHSCAPTRNDEMAVLGWESRRIVRALRARLKP